MHNGSWESTLLFKARIDSLEVNEKKRKWGGEKDTCEKRKWGGEKDTCEKRKWGGEKDTCEKRKWGGEKDTCEKRKWGGEKDTCEKCEIKRERNSETLEHVLDYEHKIMDIKEISKYYLENEKTEQ